MEVVRGQGLRGHPQIRVNGFNYYMNYVGKSGKEKTWRCVDKSCRGKLKTYGDNDAIDEVKSNFVHVHRPLHAPRNPFSDLSTRRNFSRSEETLSHENGEIGDDKDGGIDDVDDADMGVPIPDNSDAGNVDDATVIDLDENDVVVDDAVVEVDENGDDDTIEVKEVSEHDADDDDVADSVVDDDYVDDAAKTSLLSETPRFLHRKKVADLGENVILKHVSGLDSPILQPSSSFHKTKIVPRTKFRRNASLFRSKRRRRETENSILGLLLKKQLSRIARKRLQELGFIVISDVGSMSEDPNELVERLTDLFTFKTGYSVKAEKEISNILEALTKGGFIKALEE